MHTGWLFWPFGLQIHAELLDSLRVLAPSWNRVVKPTVTLFVGTVIGRFSRTVVWVVWLFCVRIYSRVVVQESLHLVTVLVISKKMSFQQNIVR
jgi:hypothetical protein